MRKLKLEQKPLTKVAIMKWTVGNKLAVGFGLALVIFVIVGVVSYRSSLQQAQAADWVSHSQEVQGQLTQLFSDMQDAETGQRGFLITGVERYLAPHTAGASRAEEDRQALLKLVSDNPAQVARAEALAPLIELKLSELQETIDLRRTNSFEAAQKVVLTGQGKNTMDDLRKIMKDMKTEEEELLKKRAAEDAAQVSQTHFTIIGGTFAALALAALAGFIITRNIAGPLKEITATADRIASGDLSAAVTTDQREDEVGVLARTFGRMTNSLKEMAEVAGKIASGDLRTTVKPQSPNDVLGNAFARMTENLREQTRQLVEGANVLGSSASEIVASTTQLASSASESAAAVSETTTTVEEVRQTAQAASQKAKAVSDSAQKAAQISQSGRKSTEEVVAGTGRIRQQMEAIAASMVRLSEQSQTIGQIVTTVEDLASQSNLLAVNAAIEAAKAGEHGKGFGVVAQEVKSLAEQSRQATNQVRAILSDIQKATAAAVLATEQGSKSVETGAKQTEAAGESIQALASSVTEAAQAATQIAASSQQQLVGVDQVAGAMENIKQASTQNVASARQLEVAARNLSELGHRLKQIIQHYKI
jgi:methyl-accepting chemotaxis protein